VAHIPTVTVLMPVHNGRRFLAEAVGSIIAQTFGDFEFLRSHPAVGIVGSARTIIDESGATIATGPAPQTDAQIRWKCLLGNPFAHPTVMIRRAVLERHRLRYDPAYPAAEDYEMWTRLLAVTRGANLAQPLLRYRLRDGISRTNKPEQLAQHDRIAWQAIRNLLPEFEMAESDVRELRGRFGGFSVREAGMDPNDPHWAGVYAGMRNAFQTRYERDAA
jgi:hypothetical protein